MGLMANYTHNQIWKRLQEIDVPPIDNDDFNKWLNAEQHIDLLYGNLTQDEIIVHALHAHTFIQSVIVDELVLAELDHEHILQWHPNHTNPRATYSHDPNSFSIIEQDNVWNTTSTSPTPSLVFLRSFDGSKRDNATYPEILQEFVHVNESHWLDPEQAFCKYNRSGELEYIATVSTDYSDEKYHGLVTITRQSLEQYLTATRSALVLLFDFCLLRHGEFNRWPDGPENTQYLNGGIAFRQKIDPGKASYCRGIQIIKPTRDKEEIINDFISYTQYNSSEAYTEFIVYDWRNRRVTNISTNPTSTINYFEAKGNSLPFETSPAFFNAEVLSKYKADNEKYTVHDTHITCRNAWYLKGYGINDAGQVHVYICDLRALPYSEQVYWKSFNEKPKAWLSQRVIDRDFNGIIPDESSSLIRIRDIISRWDQSDFDWWNSRGSQLITSTNIPISSSRAEWSQEFMNLAQLIIEGFKLRAIRSTLNARNIDYESAERSISLTEKLLRANGDIKQNQRLSGLRAVQEIRTKVRGHAGGSKADELSDNALRDHGSYLAHFEHVCDVVADELMLIEAALT